MSSVVKQLMYVLKLFRVIDGSVPFFGSVYSKETLRIMYPKYPVLDIIKRMHLCCASIIRFCILVKKRNIPFRIKNPDLDFIKETHPHCLSVGLARKLRL